ncbi:MAG TPA: DNA mismatch repair endonuclease MutL [Candidatus Eisenbacteria bacterium]|nr:DNA mismatch repair endonuclease MutL [Candidatus Eisenbacteria bacterium]
MASIRVLPPEVASKIRAGEVVDRPAAVAKELIENAIDAGSRLIAVQVAASPDKLIRVQDDGAGMSREDALLSVRRHATSKLSSEEDLEAIRTLGFRGEALASIAEVARVSLSTRSASELTGTQVEVLGGTVIGVSGVGRAVGTTVSVEDLFFNTPARLRFLKSRESEIRAVARAAWGYILTYPAIHWRFTSAGREDVDLPAAEDLLERWQVLYGRGASEGASAFAQESGEIIVRGVLGTPEQARAGREQQILTVNGRLVVSPALGTALRQGYGNLIPGDRHPMAVLMIEIDPTQVDVNVHPTKREVRFRDEGRVFQAVKQAVDATMRRHVPVSLDIPEVRLSRPAPAEPSTPGVTPAQGAGVPGSAGPDAQVDEGAAYWGAQGALLPRPRASESATALGAAPAATQTLIEEYAPAPRLRPERVEEGGQAAVRENLLETEIPIWQLHDRYLLAPIRGGLVVVDQHAAHERILYEQARARLYGEEADSQHLLFPRVLDVTAEELDHLLLLEVQIRRLGYEVSLFGEKQVAIRAVPASIPEEAAVEALRSLLAGEDAHGGGDEPPEERVAKSFACHAAVRSGQPLRPEERRALIDRLFATDLPHGDPHGRATYVRVSMEELDRRFGRR